MGKGATSEAGKYLFRYENVCCVAAVVRDSGVFEPWSVKNMLYVCVKDVMDVVFSVCIVRRGAVGARVWEV